MVLQLYYVYVTYIIIVVKAKLWFERRMLFLLNQIQCVCGVVLLFLICNKVGLYRLIYLE